MQMTSDQKGLSNKLAFVYGEHKAALILNRINELISNYQTGTAKAKWVSQNDVMLITYADSLRSEGEQPIETMNRFGREYLHNLFSAVHLLPFYPYSSDDGFSVIDYREVNPSVGNWDGIKELSEQFDLMFDGVINHISQHSEWFKQFLAGNPEYTGYFVESDPSADYSKVTRPRALPLLTKFATATGDKHVWTTFSDDQIDLNYENENVLLEILDILLMYASHGARYLRLDAIGFMWKKLGTTCIHLDETHAIVQIIREVLDLASPGTIIITETNVPHKDNISYFGNGYNEAHMVYQFPLPPLTLHTISTGNSTKILQWAESLGDTTETTSFFNFLASHDGIGVRPVEGILTKEEVQSLVDRVQNHGGFVSYKDNGDGTKSPYELNINYLDALSHPDEEYGLKVKRFMAANGILLSMIGVPGIYIHSLLGSRNDLEGVKATGRYRSINRAQLEYNKLRDELGQADSLRSQVLKGFQTLLDIRRAEPAFHPNSVQRVLYLHDQLFTLVREAENGDQIFVVINVSNEPVRTTIPVAQLGWTEGQSVSELLGGEDVLVSISDALTLEPYQVKWIKRSGKAV
ncbi:alpha-amylase family glycosyl hydrolase [Paenibacillus glycanilyticus]|uniref:Sucrose phosphorylase n=1 Tax=Paenibacillus glycanilyticus TaxID=126569 RepID=A0ABQ6G8T9_9BACL|nr:alpha-amylase family glycosyl hydrolase [Paenibacillus glycanilyticus]GLX66680.1 sucrose phosphorylase [Paenibacillus glycanilyticus]